ncbi:MAG: DUF2442 domain-containing protein [Planctomycetes bacterium]|nr:DUF2442 domain-containing protein [Planctomycetota bacterium]
MRVHEIEFLSAYRVRLTFSNRRRKVVDLGPLLEGRLFAELRDPARFRQIRIDPESGALCWPNGADICPDLLYSGRAPAQQPVGRRAAGGASRRPWTIP